MERRREVHHLVILAYPSKGHLIPALNFATLLANSCTTFYLTFVSSLHSISALELQLLQTAPNSLDRMRFFGLPIQQELISSKQDLQISRDQANSGLASTAERSLQMREGFEALMHKLACESSSPAEASSEIGPPVAIISDNFCPWSQDVASVFGLPRYVLYTSPTKLLAVQFHYPSLVAKGLLPLQLQSPYYDQHFSKDADNLVAIPALGSVSLRELPKSLKDPSKVVHQFFHGNTCLLHRAAGILVNSFYELESIATDALNERSLNPNGVPILPIGPVLPYPFFDNHPFQIESDTEKPGYIQWLDAQSPSSVLYISFGSMYVPSLAETHQIALGLEAAQTPFLWVLRGASSNSAPLSPSSAPSSSNGMLPEGFEGRNQRQGLVVREWVRQPLILSHPATGGFLSHCGWNSTLESVCAGVPLITFPQFAEQEMISRMIVAEWKVGLRLERESDESLRGENLEKVVKRLLGGSEEAEGIRRRIRELRKAASRAILQHDGSSASNLQAFLSRVQAQLQCESCFRLFT